MNSPENSAVFRLCCCSSTVWVLETEQTSEHRSVAAPHRRPLNVDAFAVVIVIPKWQFHQSPAECCYFYINPHSPQLNIRRKAALFCLKGQCYFYSPNDESPLITRTRRCGAALFPHARPSAVWLFVMRLHRASCSTTPHPTPPRLPLGTENPMTFPSSIIERPCWVPGELKRISVCY